MTDVRVGGDPLGVSLGIEGMSIEAKSYGRQTWERLKRHVLAMISFVVLILLIASFWIVPALSPYESLEINVADAAHIPAEGRSSQPRARAPVASRTPRVKSSPPIDHAMSSIARSSESISKNSATPMGTMPRT